jgi:hypothetical protein
LFPGIHAGATVKYVRGALHLGREDGAAIPGDLLDRGDDLASTDAAGDVGADAGVLAVVGPVRLGARIGNLVRPQIGNVMLPRQARIGVAFDPEPVTGVPLTIALDADIRELPAVTGPRQMVAFGGEYWLFEKRLGVRGGGRVNRIGLRERIGTAGASVAVRPGMLVDAHLSHGSRDESGWSVAARVSF